MAFKVRIQQKVYFDVENAYNYYASNSLATAEKFYNEYNTSLELIKSNPFFQIKYKEYRACKLRSFPYSIYYEVDERDKLITCYALVQLSQNQDKYPT